MANNPYSIVPRTKLDFGIDGDIPRYWLNGDVFKTRFVDALSLTFPVGERFFISTVRNYREEIVDPKLKEDVRHFMLQEGQHGMVHTQYNRRLAAQGVAVDKIESDLADSLDREMKRLPKSWTLAHTAAAEHLTAIMAFALFNTKEVFEGADPRMRAVYAWHAIEEVEHKTVAFDVLRDVAKAGYFVRTGMMLYALLKLQIVTFMVLEAILRADGFGFWRRVGIWARGLWWLYKPLGGFHTRLLPHLLRYFVPGFHPTQIDESIYYRQWTRTFNATGDPIAAGNAVAALGA